MEAEIEKKHAHFKRVFYEYYPTLCNYAFSFIKDKDSAEDIVQETFLRIWEKRADLLDSDAIRYYLFTAVRNNCLTHHQLARRADTLRESLQNMPAENFAFGEKDQELTDQRAIILDALAQLPPKCKDVFLLSRLGNLTYRDIARSLNISVKTVENQMGKALKIIRAFLKEHKLFQVIMIVGFIFYS